MSDKPPSTAKEALVAELLGDVHTLIERLERIDNNTKATTTALNEATQQYRDVVDGMVTRLRAETANVITQATEQVAKTMVGQQTDTLQKAATAAMQKALSVEVLKRTRGDWYTAIVISAALGALVASVIGTLFR
jgi:2',3'-cyclic-nucleotide 2'-phosphodiesterase (5'-nucleotidase family)